MEYENTKFVKLESGSTFGLDEKGRLVYTKDTEGVELFIKYDEYGRIAAISSNQDDNVLCNIYTNTGKDRLVKYMITIASGNYKNL